MAHEILRALEHLDAVLLEDIRTIRLPGEGPTLTGVQKGWRTRVAVALVQYAKALNPDFIVRDEEKDCIGVTFEAFDMITCAARTKGGRFLSSVDGKPVRIGSMQSGPLKLINALSEERAELTSDDLLQLQKQFIDL